MFVSIANRDKRAMIFPVKRLHELGFELLATAGTAQVLRRNGIPAEQVRKRSEGPGPQGQPTIVDRILAGDIDMVVNTPGSKAARRDGYAIRTAATSIGRPIITTVQQLGAAVRGIEALRASTITIASVQEHARTLAGGNADREVS